MNISSSIMRRAAVTAASVIACLWSLAVQAQIEAAPGQEPQKVFGGGDRAITLLWHNKSGDVFSGDLTAPASSGKLIHLSSGWSSAMEKNVDSSGQTVVETATLPFPSIAAKTRFIVQWTANSNRVLAATEVWVYPTNLLQGLNAIAGAPGILDPENRIKPLLKTGGIEFKDLDETSLESYHGKLIIAGPFANNSQMRAEHASLFRMLARKGTGVVWLLPPPELKFNRQEPPAPSYSIVPEGERAIVAAQAVMTEKLQEKPQSQLNLMEFARLAILPEPPRLPQSTP